LVNSLTTYQLFGLDQLDNEKVIFFQEISDKDREIAKEFGYDAIGAPENIGIAEGYKRLVEYATGDLFLFLENDWALIEDPKQQIKEASEMLYNDDVDVIRLRHRRNPGHPLYTLQFQGNEYKHLEHLLDCIHWTDPLMFSPLIDRIGPDDSYWVGAWAKNANWTNNPTMFRTEWLHKEIVPRMGSRDAEIDLQPWWKEQWYVVGQGKGLFTHNRIG
jgi:hypothetical protein